VKRG